MIDGRNDTRTLKVRAVEALEAIANIRRDGTEATLTDVAEGLDEIKQAIITNGVGGGGGATTKPELMSVKILGAVDQTLQLSAVLLTNPPVDQGTPVVPVITGIPQILRINTNHMPTAAVAVGGSGNIEITYGDDPIASGEFFVIGPYDIAFRTPANGYAAPIVLLNP